MAITYLIHENQCCLCLLAGFVCVCLDVWGCVCVGGVYVCVFIMDKLAYKTSELHSQK